MATSFTEPMFWPSSSWRKQNWRTRSIFCLMVGLSENSAADLGVENRYVVRSCSLYEVTLSPDAEALPEMACCEAGPAPVNCPTVSYHAPVIAFANRAPDPS